jgi:hypothetical protein
MFQVEMDKLDAGTNIFQNLSQAKDPIAIV